MPFSPLKLIIRPKQPPLMERHHVELTGLPRGQ